MDLFSPKKSWENVEEYRNGEETYRTELMKSQLIVNHGNDEGEHMIALEEGRRERERFKLREKMSCLLIMKSVC